MKKIIIILCAFFAISCSVNDDEMNDYQELLPVNTVDIPETINVGIAENILLTYIRPSNCHAFNDLYYVKNSNERTVAVISTYFASNGNCTSLNAETETSFKFKADAAGIYVFKFYQGKDANNEDIYLTYEVEAID
jgi:hypothetical protein